MLDTSNSYNYNYTTKAVENPDGADMSKTQK
jgi:hypothetical protein